MIRHRRSQLLLGIVLAFSPAAAAFAQSGPSQTTATAPPASAPAPSKTTGTAKGLTVTATAPPVRTSIDRRSYDLTKDLNATGGTLADVLRSVPALAVDVQGNLSIRGDSNVVIMVDGKPSTLFQGPGRAQMLQSLPADEFERVEVITNPTAEFSPEGTAGIVNLISKKVRKPGQSGSVRASADLTGRANGGINANQKTDKLTLTFNATVRHDRSDFNIVEDRDGLPAPGVAPFSSQIVSAADSSVNTWTARGGLDYDLNPATRISAAANYVSSEVRETNPSQTLGFDAAGDLDQILNRNGNLAVGITNAAVQGSVKHSFAGAGHDLSVSLLVNHANYDIGYDFADANALPALPTVFDDNRSRNTLTLTDLKADYEQPMAHSAKLKAGYELKIEDVDVSETGFLAALSPSGPLQPAQADAFHFERYINALYTTYEQPIGKFTFLAGLRLEQTNIEIHDLAANLLARPQDFHPYPTLHLNYQLTPTQSLLASYGERVQRPQPTDFNPYRQQVSPFLIRMGNPDLKPQQTQDFELSWQYQHRTDFVRATLYDKISSGGVDNAVTDLGNDVFLYRRENLVSSTSTGAELEITGQLAKTLTYALYGDVDDARIDASTLGLIAPRSLTSARGNATLTWQITPKDMFQVYGRVTGPTLNAEGYVEAWKLISAGYRHKFDDKLSFFATLQDAFDIAGYVSVSTTPQLFDRTAVTPHYRTLFLGLTYNFGAGPKRDAPLDLGVPATPPLQ